MSEIKPNITIAVDVTNPGQFFACCGLLELADRLWPGAEGWFTDDRRHFCIFFSGENEGTLRHLLTILAMTSPTVINRLKGNGLEVAPIIAPLEFTFECDRTAALTLDAWTQVRVDKGVAKVISNPPWNFWSGQQKSSGIWNALRSELAKQMASVAFFDSAELFSHRLFQGGRFGFDCSPAWNPLDVGFSPNEQGIEVESSPVVELLAAMGLQRFRPAVNRQRDGFDYYTWHCAYSPPVAAAAMAGAISDRSTRCFRASVVSRGQYAALSQAFPLINNAGDFRG